MTALFALGLLIAIAGAIKALVYFFTSHDAREWHLTNAIFSVQTITGERLSGHVMTRKLDGNRQYRKCTDAELRKADDDERTEMPLI